MIGDKRIITSTKITILVLAALAITLLPNYFVRADAGVPPTIAWFMFEYPGNLHHGLLGVQLVSCPNANCERPVLLQQYGICNDANCLAAKPLLSGFEDEFGCEDNKCRSSAWPSHGGTDFRLIVHFPDETLVSKVISALPSNPTNSGEVTTWKVSVLKDTLAITQEYTATNVDVYPPHPISQNFSIPGLSVIVELIVSGLCFWIFLKNKFVDLLKNLLIVLLINLVTLPVVWMFFPTLGYFQSAANRTFGIFVLIIAAIYTSLLVVIYRADRENSRLTLIFTLISLPSLGLCFLFTFFLTSYGYHTVITQGLPSNLIIVLSEVFAATVESVLMTTLSKPTISLRWAFIIGFLMNAASFFVGQIMIGSKLF